MTEIRRVILEIGGLDGPVQRANGAAYQEAGGRVVRQGADGGGVRVASHGKGDGMGDGRRRHPRDER